MPEADETIITQFLVEAEKAIEGTEEYRKQIDTVKRQLKELAVETGQSFDVIIEGIKRVKKEDISKIFEPGDPRAQNALQEFGKAASQALRETKQEAAEAVRVLKMLQGINLGATRVEFERTRDATVSFLNAMRGAHQATQPFSERIQGFVSGLRELGSVGKFVFGTVFGIGAVQAIRRVIDIFREAISSSLEFQQSLFTLEVAVRGLQRMGLDTTIEGWDRRIGDLKKQFPIFSRKEFTDAASLAALMTREFGFTEAQIADLVRQSAILSEITGKDLNEAVRGVTFAIGSGYFESLQRAGINISRQVVANKALELGYEGVYNELEPVIRASVTYAVIQDNLNAIQEDAGRIVDTTTGQVQRLKKRWDDLLISLGNTITGTDDAKDAVSELADSVEALTELIKLLSPEHDNLATSLVRNVAMFGLLQGTLKTFINFMSGEATNAVNAFIERFEFLGNFLETFAKNIEQIRTNLGLIKEPILDNFVDEDALDALQSFEIGGVEFSEEEYQAIVDATRDLAEEIEKIEEESFKQRRDALDKFLDDGVDRYRDYQQKLIDLQQDLSQRLADIDLKASRSVSDEIENNAFRVQEALRKAAFRREDAERKFREREISAERKFQEKLRQLRENFLLDLEDAVRERDARQIIRLTRQYNLRRDQLKREEGLSKTDRTAQFQEELRQIEQQKQERLRQLAIEHQRRLEDIARQAERERQQAQLDFERRREEERLRFERDREDRKKRLEQTLNDIDESTQERINSVVEGLQKEYDLSKPQLDAISTLYENAYGPNGRIDNAVAYTIARLQQLAQFMNMLRTSMGTVEDPIRTEKEYDKVFFDPIRREKEYDFAGGQAEGGTIIARKPTVAIFGEAGDEAATFTPLNKLGGESMAKITPMDASNMSRDGRLRLEFFLSPDLEYRIIDNTLGEMADINFAIERARK